jgi:hypothetical protein
VPAGEVLPLQPGLPGRPEALIGHPRQLLNRQRAWRQAEDRLLLEPAR